MLNLAETYQRGIPRLHSQQKKKNQQGLAYLYKAQSWLCKTDFKKNIPGHNWKTAFV